jgi:ComEC/Rec2-related protein
LSTTSASKSAPSTTSNASLGWRRFDSRYRHFIARPTLAIALAFAAGGWLAYSPYLILLLPLALLLGRGRLLLVCCLFILGIARTLPSGGVAAPLPDGMRVVHGRVATMPEMGIGHQRFVLRTERGEFLVYASEKRLLVPGDLVKATGWVSELRGRQAEYWGRRGVDKRINASHSGSGVEVLRQGPPLSVVAARWRESAWRSLRAHLPYEPASVAMAILFGQDRLLTERTAEDMRRAGTYHLVATSGFNVLILVAGLMLVLSHLPVPRWAQIALALALLGLYAFAVGMNPPIVRAITMAGIYLSAMFFFRMPDGLSAWGAAALAYLSVHPYAVLDAGFQLSFGVVLALILYLPPALRTITRWSEQRFRRASVRMAVVAVAAPLLTTVVAQAAALPILAHHFGQLSLIAPVANLFTGAAVPFVYLGSAASAAFQLLSEPVSLGFDLLVTGAFSQWIVSVNALFGNLPYSSVQFSPLPAWAGALGFLWVPLFSRHHLYPVPTPEEASGERLDEGF